MKEKLFKISLIIIITLLIVQLFNCKVFADDNNYTCDLDITGNSEVKAGEEVIYELRVKNINAEDGILSFETLINYNDSLVDVTVESDDNGNWNKASMIENYLTMTRSDLLPSSEDQVIAKIKVTANSDATLGDTTIDLTKIKFTMEGENFFELEDKSIELKIVQGEEDSQEDPDQKEDEDSKEDDKKKEDQQKRDNTSKNSVENNTTTVKNLITQNTTSGKVLPFTGIVETGIVILIITLIVVAYIYYKKYKTWKNV